MTVLKRSKKKRLLNSIILLVIFRRDRNKISNAPQHVHDFVAKSSISAPANVCAKLRREGGEAGSRSQTPILHKAPYGSIVYELLNRS